MSARRLSLRRLGDERGSALVVAGIMAVAFVLMGVVIVEVGQWFEHRRHIQARADAAAFAGGQVLQECFDVLNGVIPEAQAEADIEGWAKSYGGVAGGSSTQTDAPYNRQFGTSTSDLMSFQSNTYPSSGTPNPARDLPPECDPDSLMLDVKMTQAGIPPIFSISPLATVHGWARVQLQKIESIIPDMPLVPPDVDPSNVAVTFVDDSTGQALTGCSMPGCVFPLTSAGALNGLSMWGGSASIPVAAGQNIGMRVSIGNVDGSCAGVNQAAPSSTTHYRCYVYNDSGNSASPLGIIRIRGYAPSSGPVSSPTLRGVSATTCSGTPFFSIVTPGLDGNGNCSVTIQAGVDFPAGVSSPHVRATVNGTGVNGTNIALINGSGNTWTSNPSDLALPVSGGPYNIRVAWCDGTCNLNGNNWTSFAGGNPVQQVFSGSDGSDPNAPAGPILASWIQDTSDNPAYTLPDTGSGTTDLNISIGLYGGVHLATPCTDSGAGSGASYNCPTDPPILLRLVTSSSQNYAIDCGTISGNPGQNANLYQQLRYGCANRFSINEADTCPDPSNTSEYPDCAPVQTGGAVGQATQAMDDRFAPVVNGVRVCDANNYPNTTEIPNDPRVVTLLVTDFTAFGGSGGSTAQDVPITHVASFYVTGWNTENNFHACDGINGPAPPGVRTNGQTASIWGHFIKYYEGSGIPSGFICKPGEIEPCALALVR